MTNQTITQASKPKFDLEDRTAMFMKTVIQACRQVKLDAVNRRMVDQLIGSAGSVGANYREANDSLGRKDFLNRLRIARKEAKEALFWLEMLQEANPTMVLEPIQEEARQLKAILSSIIDKFGN